MFDRTIYIYVVSSSEKKINRSALLIHKISENCYLVKLPEFSSIQNMREPDDDADDEIDGFPNIGHTNR